LASQLDNSKSGLSEAEILDGEKPERNWLPLAIAAALVVAFVAAGFLLTGHKTDAAHGPSVNPDPDATSLPLTNLAMSESGNLAGGKLTYIDGHIANKGNRTVTSVLMQVLLRNAAHEIAQNDTMPLSLIRTREPYIDTIPVAALPLTPGSDHDFRLILDRVSPEWDGAVPELRILRVDSK
jgi:hypothetical protein